MKYKKSECYNSKQVKESKFKFWKENPKPLIIKVRIEGVYNPENQKFEKFQELSERNHSLCNFSNNIHLITSAGCGKGTYIYANEGEKIVKYHSNEQFSGIQRIIKDANENSQLDFFKEEFYGPSMLRLHDYKTHGRYYVHERIYLYCELEINKDSYYICYYYEEDIKVRLQVGKLLVNEMCHDEHRSRMCQQMNCSGLDY